MTLTDEMLREYIESAEKATPGPWTNAKSALVYLLPDGDAICEALHIEGEFRTHIYNADFIAASRTIGPAAAEEVLRLRAAERIAFNAGYSYGVEPGTDASSDELDCAWELYLRDRREQALKGNDDEN